MQFSQSVIDEFEFKIKRQFADHEIHLIGMHHMQCTVWVLRFDALLNKQTNKLFLDFIEKEKQKK